MSVNNTAGCIGTMKNLKAPSPISCVTHPYSLGYLTRSLSLTPGSTYPIPHGIAEDLLKDFFRITLNQVGFYEDGNIAIDSSDDMIGAMFSKAAMVIVESKAMNTERERDASLRAWEVVCTSDYGVFELDDGYGLKMTYDATVTTNS